MDVDLSTANPSMTAQTYFRTPATERSGAEALVASLGSPAELQETVVVRVANKVVEEVLPLSFACKRSG
jgi:hypothetical protein